MAEGGEGVRHRAVRWDDPAASVEAAGRLAGLPFLAASLFHHSAGALGSYAGGLVFDLTGSYRPGGGDPGDRG